MRSEGKNYYGIFRCGKKAGQLGYEALQEKREQIEQYKIRYDHLEMRRFIEDGNLLLGMQNWLASFY